MEPLTEVMKAFVDGIDCSLCSSRHLAFLQTPDASSDCPQASARRSLQRQKCLPQDCGAQGRIHSRSIVPPNSFQNASYNLP
ncbi:unnamed protein product [Ectocarpus sp. 8 AP-2014]